MGLESFDVVRFDLWPLLQEQMIIAKSKSAYKSLFLGPRGFVMCNHCIGNHGLGVF